MQVTGTAGVPTTATAALVNVGVVSPSAPGLLSIGLNSSATAASGLIVYAAGESGYLSVIVPLDAQYWYPQVSTGGENHPTTSTVTFTDPDVVTANRPLGPAKNPEGVVQTARFVAGLAIRLGEWCSEVAYDHLTEN